MGAAAEGVGEEFFGEAAVVVGAAGGDDEVFEGGQVGEGFAGDELAGGGGEGLAAILVAPEAHGVEVFEGEAEGVHAVVAGGTEGLGAVGFEGLAVGELAAVGGFAAGVEGGDIGGSGGRGNAEDIVEDEEAAFDGGSAGGVGSDGEEGAHGEDAAAGAIGGEVDEAHFVACDAGDVVVGGELAVEESLAAGDEFEDAAVFLEEVAEKEFDFAAHGAAEVAAEFDAAGAELGAEGGEFGFERGEEGFVVGLFGAVDGLVELAALVEAGLEGLIGAEIAGEDDAGVDADAFDVAGLEPLAGEVFDKFLGAIVGEEAADLGAELGAQLAAVGEVGEFGVWHGGPEEIREAGGEGRFVEEGVGGGVGLGEGFFEAEEEARGGEEGREGAGDPFLERTARGLGGVFGEAGEALYGGWVGGAAEGEGGEAAEDIAGEEVAGRGVGGDAIGGEEAEEVVRAGGVLGFEGAFEEGAAEAEVDPGLAVAGDFGGALVAILAGLEVEAEGVAAGLPEAFHGGF